MPDALIIPGDLTCAQCGYNLRTLPTDSNCPECGRAIIDSINARPIMAWMPDFRRGVTFFGLAILALLLGSNWLYRNWFSIATGKQIDNYAYGYVVTAIIFFPAAWWMSKPASLFPRDPARFRKWLMILTAAQLAFAGIRIYFFNNPWPLSRFWGNVVVICVTAPLPLAFDVEPLLLLTLLIRPLPIIPNSLPRPVVRGVWVLLLYVLVFPDIIVAISNFTSIAYLNNPLPSGSSYFPSSWVKVLRVLLLPSGKLRRVIWWILLLVILHCRYRLSGRVMFQVQNQHRFRL